jgi:hypothetical protein
MSESVVVEIVIRIELLKSRYDEKIVIYREKGSNTPYCYHVKVAQGDVGINDDDWSINDTTTIGDMFNNISDYVLEKGLC